MYDKIVGQLEEQHGSYLWRNILPNITRRKSHIGQARDFKKRMVAHKSRTGDITARITQGIKKHGWATFTKEIIDEAVDAVQLSLLECLYIAKFQSCNPEKGYNKLKGGYNTGMAKHRLNA